MASARTASIKITVDTSSFKSGMDQIENKTRSTGASMGAALGKSLKSGFDSAKRSAGELIGTLKGVASTAATLGGAVGFGAMIKGAIDMESRAVRLSSTLGTLTGKSITAASAQSILDRVTDKSKISFEQAAMAANNLAGIAGADRKDAMAQFEDAIVRSQLQAQRLGVEGELISRVYGRLMAKGVAATAKEAEGLTEEMAQFGRIVLGIDPDEAIDPTDMAEFAAFTKLAGINMGTAIALLEKVGGDVVKDMGQSATFIEEFGNVFRDVASLGDLRKELKISPEDLNASKSGFENMLTVLEKSGPKGVESIMKSFGNPQTKAAMRKLIGEGLVVDIEKGKKGTSERLKLRAEELRTQIKMASKSTADYGKMQADNARLTSTTSAKFQDAMNKIQLAFSKPETIEALNSLADNLPAFAKGISKMVDFVVKHPMLAAGGLGGAKIGASFASSALVSAGQSLGGAAIGAMKAGGPALGKSIATTMTTAGPFGAGGKGGRIGNLAVSTLAVTGSFLAGAAAGTALGEATIGKEFDKASETGKGLKGLTVSAEVAAAQNSKRAPEMIAKLEAAIAAAEQKQKEGGIFGTSVTKGQLTAGAAGLLLGPAAALLGGGLASTGEKKLSGVEDAKAALEKLKASQDNAAKGSDEVARAADRAAKGLDAAAKAAKKLGKDGPEKGPKSNLSTGSGSNPVRPGA